MSKSSTVTARERPAARTMKAQSGGFAVIAETIDISSRERVEIHDITDAVMAFVQRSGIKEGMLSLWSMHTTCSVFINEPQPALEADIKAFLERVARRDQDYKHNHPDHSDCDRSNADSHLRAMVLGHSVTMQISGGELVAGQWQRVLCAEMDGPRTRTIRAQAMGMTAAMQSGD
jgi:secondary thiamine-phosphate synthase enzyme